MAAIPIRDTQLNKIAVYLTVIVEAVLVLATFLLVNVNALVGAKQFPQVAMFAGSGWSLIPGCAFLILTVAVLLFANKLWAEYLAAWQQNKLLVLFLVVAGASLLWSVYFAATLYKLVFLFLATIVGAYIAIRYKLKGVITILMVTAAVSVLLSWVIVVFSTLGTMDNAPYTGSWRGMFWHRNHMGNITAFFSMILLYVLLFDSAGRIKRPLVLVLYLLAATLVFGSHSAGGVVVFIVLNFTTLLGYSWLRWHARIKVRHYQLFGALAIFGIIVFATNSGFFFGLLGRSATMTGRIPLWQELLSNIFTQRPFLGYGYGALWMQNSFREYMMNNQGWTLFQVFFSDNGFLDILLNLGLLGFGIFISMFFAYGIRSFRSFVAAHSWIRLFPLLAFAYFIVGNLAYSFFLEVDQFVWMLLVMMMFATTPLKSAEIPGALSAQPQ